MQRTVILDRGTVDVCAVFCFHGPTKPHARLTLLCELSSSEHALGQQWQYMFRNVTQTIEVNCEFGSVYP